MLGKISEERNFGGGGAFVAWHGKVDLLVNSWRPWASWIRLEIFFIIFIEIIALPFFSTRSSYCIVRVSVFSLLGVRIFLVKFDWICFGSAWWLFLKFLLMHCRYFSFSCFCIFLILLLIFVKLFIFLLSFWFRPTEVQTLLICRLTFSMFIYFFSWFVCLLFLM